MIDVLIDKKDNVEIIGLKIADILATEVSNQMSLASNAGKNQTQWKMRIFYERANPWEVFLNEQTDFSPIVNVTMENTNFIANQSDPVKSQKAETIFNVDVYGFGVASVDGSGHESGDKAAALKCLQGMRLVRNILMSANYTYLGMRGVVEQRFPNSIQLFQPQLDNLQMQHVHAGRLSLSVKYNEHAPQFTPTNLETVFGSFVDGNNQQVVLFETQFE